MALCGKCGAEATFRCLGKGSMMPTRLEHEPHNSCDECDRGDGCRMVAGVSLKSDLVGEWCPLCVAYSVRKRLFEGRWVMMCVACKEYRPIETEKA